MINKIQQHYLGFEKQASKENKKIDGSQIRVIYKGFKKYFSTGVY